MTARYAVFGNPIKHSKSPQIHTAFAAQTGEDLSYEAMLIAEGGFPEGVNSFLDGEGRGLNVTIPFKEEAWALAQQRSSRAQLAGAVNTLYRNEQGELCGDNTDGVGLVTDIVVNNGGQIKGQRVLVLGAGGAVRGVLEPILAAEPADLVIANRTLARAETLRDIFVADAGCPVSAVSFADLQGQQFDLVINGTAASLQGEVPPLPDDLLAANAWCYDMMYAAEPTAFNLWAEAHGAAKVIDGLGMLVEQAAESFSIWRGVRPETSEVIAELRRQLTQS